MTYSWPRRERWETFVVCSAEAGCSARQIMAVLGHKTLAEAERYTRDAKQDGLAHDGIGIEKARTGNRVTQTAPLPFGEIANKREETE